MKITRRGFFQLAGAASVSLIPEWGHAGTEEPDRENAYGVLVDTALCIGCRKCEWACNQENKLSGRSQREFEDKSVLAVQRRPSNVAYTVINGFPNDKAPDKTGFLKVQCLHCNHPACSSACIVGALKKSELGPVTYDAWKCIGCRYCMVACPFQIPAYEYENALDPRVMKCTFCAPRVREGKRPACVEICPSEVLTFGRRRDLLALAHRKIDNASGLYTNHVYGEFEVGGTSWLYLASTDFAATELPRLGTDPIPQRTETIQHGIFKSFMPPIALYGLLGLIMHTMKQEDKSRERPE
jgi:formate dehydrogenase iron-sulfur subunit